MHFVFTGIAYFFKDDVKIERIYDHGRRLVFYGIAGSFKWYQAIISMNFLQYGIYHAVCAWVLLIISFVLHSMSLMREIKENYQNIGVAFYYLIIAVWYFGIVFFYFYNALNWLTKGSTKGSIQSKSHLWFFIFYLFI